MKAYFENMQRFGKELKPGRIKRAAASMEQLKLVEKDIAQRRKDIENTGVLHRADQPARFDDRMATH